MLRLPSLKITFQFMIEHKILGKIIICKDFEFSINCSTIFILKLKLTSSESSAASPFSLQKIRKTNFSFKMKLAKLFNYSKT